jgi:3-phenylpropionate/trans-cinnamate dioxygenase ferredoxin reductase subunit
MRFDPRTSGGIAIIGAGHAGTEAAFALRLKGVDGPVTLINGEETLPYQRPPLSKSFLQRGMTTPLRSSDAFVSAKIDVVRHQSRGAEIILDVGVTDIQCHNSLGCVLTLSNGVRIDADLVVEAVGVTPRLELAKQADLRTDIGIIVDRDLLTSDPRISAIGDCAQFPLCEASRAIVLTSVQNSANQAKHVARRLSGVRISYSAVPWFWSDQADDKLQIVGLVPQCADRVVRRPKNDRSFSIFSFQNDLLTSVETLNSPAEHMIARRLLGASVPIRPGQAEDPRFDLASLLSLPSQTRK